ncbi:MAG: hypothetical protein EDX89_02865 [Acidobacteria bacterium]|nr:MAG: hypothetical protein EDX89_02865 [Acidobacteriota bacterium]
MKRLLRGLLDVEEGEGKAVALCFLQAVFLGLPRLFTLTAGAALFLARYPAADVPWVYIAASLVLPASGLLHLWAGRRLSFVRMQLLTLLVLAAVPLALFLVLRSSTAAWPAFALFVWCGVELHFTNIVLWSSANRTFTVRQGKRLFGLIGAGEIVAAIAGGSVLPLLTRLLGTTELLLLSVLGFVLTFLGFAVSARVLRGRIAHGPDRRGAPSGWGELGAVGRERFLLLIFLTYALVLSAGFFVNNVFYFQVAETFPRAADVAVFLGRFTAVASVLGLVLRSLLSGRFLLRFGLMGGLVATPAALLLAALVVLHVGRSGLPSPALFWAVVAMRLLERLLTGALGQPAYYSLYQPLSRERRVRVQTAAETIAAPIAGGLTGAVLLLLTKGLGVSAVGLTAAFLPVLLGWLGAAVSVGRAFPGALTTALRRRGVTGADLTVNDPASLEILERGLSSPRPAEVLYCLRLLEEAEHPRLPDLLRRVLAHPDPAVRAGAYGAVERSGDAGWVPLLSARLASEEAAARGALLRALGASGRESVRPLLEEASGAKDPATRLGALVALARHAGVPDGHPALLELDRLARSADGAERAAAAGALGEVGGARAASGLALLLVDADLAVRRTAVRSAGHVRQPELWPLLVACLEVPGLRAEAVRALLESPEAASRALVSAYQAPGSSPSLRRAVVQVLGRVHDATATRFLVGELAFAERQLLSDVLWSLRQCGFRAAGPDRRIVENGLREEARRGSLLVAARRDLADTPGAELLVAALGQELVRTQRRICLFLSFLLDPEAMLRVASGLGLSAAQRDLALELFETRVDRAHARSALPVLAERSEEAPLSAPEHLERLLSGRPRAGSWIRACAVDALAARPEGLPEGRRRELLEDDDLLVRETAAARWAGGGEGERRLSVVDRVRVLRGVSIFREIDDEILAELAPRLSEVRVGAREEVWGEGDFRRAMYVVSEGSLRLEAPGEPASLLRPGQTFGELSALEPEAAPERVTATEPSRLLRLSDVDLHDVASTWIEVVRGIVAVLCQRVRAAPVARATRPAGEGPAPAAAPSAWAANGEALSPLDRVLVLKTAEIFAEVPDDVLADVAGRTREVRVRRGEVLFRKGDPGTTTYVVAAGRLRVHVGDRVVAEVAERAVVGELAALSSEPRTASVSAAEDSLLLTLDQESLFDLMQDQHEIARGIIRVLVGRLRAIQGGPRA